MSKRPKNQARKKVPGTFRTHEGKGPDLNAEDQRIVLYLPVPALDRAEQQSIRAKTETLQRYCEALLLRAIDAEDDQDRRQTIRIGSDRADDIRTIADDPDYLDEWTATLLESSPQVVGPPALAPPERAGLPAIAEGSSATEVERPAAEVVLRHAGLMGDDPGAFLASLRRGEPIGPGVGRELSRALIDLESDLRGEPTLDRRLCYALHRLAFEGQVLVSEGGAAALVDEATVDLLRRLQEAVDRVLSGQDIRYYTNHERTSPTDG